MALTGTFDAGVLLRLTTAICRTQVVEDIYQAALDAFDEGLGVRRASILLFDTDGVMRFKAWRGISDGYRAAVEGHTPWTPETTDAVPIVVTDVSHDTELASLLPVFHAEQIAGLAFVPLIGSGRVIGKFMLYFDAPRTLGPEELTLAGIIAAQVAFAVERTRALVAVARSEERLRFALDAANMGTWDWDVSAQVVHWSDNLARVHGLPPDTFDGTFASYEREIHPDDTERVLASLRRALEEGTLHDVEYRIVSPDGTVRWVEGKGRVERKADGTPTHMSGVCMDVTPRKRAERARLEALEESHRLARRLAAIVESSDDAIISKDLDGIVTSWNPAAERMFGYSSAEVIGQPITRIVPGDLLDQEAGVLRRVGSGEAIENAETSRRRKDGRLLDVALTVSPVRDEHGAVVGASTIARDVTLRKQSEREMADLQKRLTTLIGASASLLDTPDTASVRTATVTIARELVSADAYGIWRADAGAWQMVKSEGLSPAFSDRIIRTFAGDPAPGGTWFADPLPVPDVNASALLGEQKAAYEAEGIRSMLVCPMRFGGERSGTLVFYYRTPHTFSDVEVQTAQALANLAAAATTTAELYEEQRRQRDAAEYASHQAAFLAEVGAVLARSLDYHETLSAVAKLAVPEIADWCAVDVVDDNGQIERLAVAHVNPEKLPYAQLLHERYPEDPNTAGTVPHVIRSGRPAMMEFIPPDLLDSASKDDEHRRLFRELALTSYICVPLTSGDRTLGALTFVFAESGRRYTEQDLRFAQDVAARASLAIENAHAYQRVHEANRLKDDFLATLSHELRTPLNAILGYAQMLGMHVLRADKQAQAVAVVRRNAESLKQIIDDVLDVSRITAGKLRLNVQPVELASILKNAVATLQPAADAKGVRLQAVIDPGVPPVSGDADRLQQVVWNLLSNAVKFTPRGGRVQLRLEQESSHAQIVVSDTGRGIDPAFAPHLFERFRQADSRFSREHGGLGLGLSIVRELVQLHGGSVTATSEGLGMGATFRVELPLMIVHPPRLSPAPHPRVEQYAITDVRLDGVTVLAVDDEEDALGLVRDILEAAGARVTTVGSGARALEVLHHEAHDALISDIGMPHMDGIELIRTVRQSLPAPRNRMPAAALTAYARSEDRVNALVSGFQMHLAKPVNPSELVVAVAALVRRTH